MEGRRSRPSVDQMNRVCHLVCVILGERAASIEVVKKVAEGWYHEVREQRRRPTSRVRMRDRLKIWKDYREGFNQKLIMNNELALQFLSLKLCEPTEKDQEREHLNGGPMLVESYFVIRYIKHLLYRTLPHRSFHVTVGLCRLLYDFEKGETSEIYEELTVGSLVHDSGLRETTESNEEIKRDDQLYKDEQQYKEWRLKLMGLLQMRFNNFKHGEKHHFITIVQGSHGKKLFITHPDQSQFTELVKHCLDLFTPWKTSHLIPAGFKPDEFDYTPFRFKGKDQDQESPVEENRMHALIDPQCFTAFCVGYGLGSPISRLAVPYFNLPNDKGSSNPPPVMPPPNFNPPPLTPAEAFEIADYLIQRDERRAKSRPRTLSIEIEGIERARLRLAEGSSVRLTLDEDDDLIQVYSDDEGGKLLLASLLLSSSGALRAAEPWKGSTLLPGGREISIIVDPSREHLGEATGALVDITYKERLFSVERLRHAVGNLWPKTDWPRTFKPAAVSLAIVAIALLLVSVVWLSKEQPREIARHEGQKQKNGKGAQTHVEPQSEDLSPNVNSSPASTANQASTSQVDTVMTPKNKPGSQPPWREHLSGSSPKQPQIDVPEAVVKLQDGNRLVALDRHGTLTGIEALPLTSQRTIKAVLKAQKLEKPRILTDLSGKPGMLMGGAAEIAEIELLSPAATVVQEDRPTLRWRALDGAASYTVAVFDEDFNPVVKSEPLSTTEWQVTRALRRAATYLWQVTALVKGRQVTSPKQPAPDAKFKVLDGSMLAQLNEAKRIHADSHLALGILYAQAGLLEEAERELQALVADNPRSEVAQKLLADVQTWRRR